jgi:hypothetical protein
MITVSPKQAFALTCKIINAGLVPILKGSPGTSKSAVMNRVAKQNNLKFIDVRLAQVDPVELNGFPKLDGDKAQYVPMEIFPTEFDALPMHADGVTPYAGWFLFFDELTSAAKAVQAAAYKIILDRQVGLHNLHAKVHMAAAGNLTTDGAVVNNMSTALQSRLVHLNMGIDKNDWVDWAIGAGVNKKVISFIEFRPELIHKFDPKHNDDTFACQRTWEFCSDLMNANGDPTLADLAMYAGTVSEGVAREFITYVQIFSKLVSFQDILRDPLNTPVPHEPSSRYALATMLASNLNKLNGDIVMQYIDRMPAEFQLLTVRFAFRSDKSIIQSKAVMAWVRSNRKEWTS